MKEMSYQSPIDVIIGQMNTSYENEIYKAIQNVGINIDKNELLKALQYDRKQYQKGYADRDSEIIRCKDCKYAVLTYQGELKYCKYFYDEYGFTNSGDPLYLEGDFFCAAGERREVK